MRRLAHLAAIVALGLLLFSVWMRPSVLAPTNVGWLLTGDDRGQSMIGLAAYLRAGGPWPSLHQPLLAAPEGMTLLFTDSIPLIGFALKPFARRLPAGLQLIGVWYLLCTLLQAGFAWALVRRHAPDALTAWLGAALLAAMPALFNRYGHASLCAQWLILWALWVFVDERRSRSAWWWPAVLGVAAMVHSYLLLMAAAIWGSAVLMQMVQGPARWRTAARAALALGLVALIAAAHGVFAARFASTGLYGFAPLALDAWWNPQNPGYSALLPSSPDRRGVGYEGLQYLGAGLLAVLLVALVRTLRAPRLADPDGGLRRLWWLLPAFAALTVVAIGPTLLWRGAPIARVELPRSLVEALDPVRASGRLVWPATYTLAYWAIAIVARTPRAAVTLAAALAAQVVDLAPMLASIRATSAAADDPTSFRRTRDPRWRTLIARAAAIDFQPSARFGDLQLMEEVAYRAVLACRPARFFYASREAVRTRARIERDAAAFLAGRIDPTRLYVLGASPPATLTGRVRWLDGIEIIPPTTPAPPPDC